MMSISLEVQMERMDSKIEKFIGVTETILRSQEKTLEEIKEIVSLHDEKFITKEEFVLMESASLSKSSDDLNNKLLGFENRLDKKYKTIASVAAFFLVVFISLIEIWPSIT